MSIDDVATGIGYSVMVCGGVSMTLYFLYLSSDIAIRSLCGMKTVWEFAIWRAEQKGKKTKDSGSNLN